MCLASVFKQDTTDGVGNAKNQMYNLTSRRPPLIGTYLPQRAPTACPKHLPAGGSCSPDHGTPPSAASAGGTIAYVTAKVGIFYTSSLEASGQTSWASTKRASTRLAADWYRPKSTLSFLLGLDRSYHPPLHFVESAFQFRLKPLKNSLQV
jgi:hypothetical protein